ncbi:hypothetical protein PtA15_4A620 [Puccinia triticina]|uniref:Secreted protein n=1 Tax=Puccinia triticina TaxID=208348 RepID=A0ABY7CGX7_9BASI|nr:uncharacterized protein PtA15_4A620 [Puccinia triticina]WAQ84168.1 hypothetical protein PtA15_4A620 [Puccinia triticina]WAR55000.1 hypothetical protein PtB15_4B618 [Puccinia triticina]
MQFFVTVASFLLFFHSSLIVDAESDGSLRPGSPNGNTGPSKIFPFKEYKDFQISDGTAGHSLENAQKVFVDPFNNIDLKDITQTDLNNLVSMSRTAVERESDFITAQSETGGSKKNGDPRLAAGLIANKVLKLVGELQVIKLHQKLNLHQKDPKGRLIEHQTKLTKNTKLDRANAGKTMISKT